jgi:hypothetical protein
MGEEKGEKKSRNGRTKKRIEEAYMTRRLRTSYLFPCGLFMYYRLVTKPVIF